MLGHEIALPLWLALPVLVLALLGTRAYIVEPLVRRALLRRERDLKTRLNTTLTRPLPKVLQVPRRVLTERLFNDPVVQQSIETAAETDGHEAAEAEARDYIDELMPSFFALFYFHIGYRLARRWLRSMYDIQIVKQLPPNAYADIPEDASIVLVGNHRSNLDVAVLSYLAARTSMISFAAGEWASVWPVNRIMQMSGCYIIRRESQGKLYKIVLARYIHMMIGARMPQGIFLEGGLSRDGALQPIKLGLMRYILAGLGTEGTRDIVFIPVAFNYDRVPEDMTLLAHQDQGFVKKSRLYTIRSTAWHSLGMIARLLRVRRQRFGQAAVSFGPAFSTRAWLTEQGVSVEGLDDAERKSIVAPIAETIIGQIADMIPVLPVSLVATVIRNTDDGAITRRHLRSEVLHLIERLRMADVPLAIDEAHDPNASELGLQVLLSRGVVTEESGILQPNPGKASLLDYYARTISHYMIHEEQRAQLSSILTVQEPASK
ncbi:1-acyl-sn-glycerol-3-phosphate acyltransferase [Alisedimentitalea sp. MJ-SS2]|uniref:1-acyl-sn-glycerol-3-phosphate acyltransferase n=1 Tax=Aliisedimentitalea sp. MJ-SS2 TaxID=3049795 RepID=UPI002913297C|nr:1-acyl-sn-glycerol-3-phosphate acyltransferase [Alisedimentitalea sp. MJ-SS2]MDU8929945.1 1-acyl-sn-glycerol-3-phosphate acyltransferase [Alisedimentitalea sp. MJ-SS2]